MLWSQAVNMVQTMSVDGLECKILEEKELAVFLKYNYTLAFDEREIDDISKFSVLGKFNDVYYIAPNYKEKSESCKKIPELSEEPKPESFCDLHLYGTEYDDTEKHHEGKIIYRFPKVNDVETSKKIANLLSEYNISKDQLQILLEYNQKESIRLRENNTRPWNLENIYKFSWIFNKPIEELLAIDYHEETHESLFDPVLFLEHYVPDENEIWEFNEEPVELLDKESQEGFFIIEKTIKSTFVIK